MFTSVSQIFVPHMPLYEVHVPGTPPILFTCKSSEYKDGSKENNKWDK